MQLVLKSSLPTLFVTDLLEDKNYKKNVKLSKVQYVQCNFVLC